MRSVGRWQFIADAVAASGKRWMMMAAVVVIAASPMVAQNAELQRKLAVVKKTVAENKQKLRHYQWIETTQLTLKGEPKPPSQDLCQYGANGQVQKTPICSSSATEWGQAEEKNYREENE